MSNPVRSAASLRVFLDRIIDYAGLFTPASLDMRTSVTNYSRYLHHPQQWVLGRFVLTITRLDEFLNARGNTTSAPWRLSGIVSANIEAEMEAIGGFNRTARGARIDVFEVRVSSAEEIERVRKNQPPGAIAMYEISAEQAGELLPILQELGLGAKVRTGGVVEEAIPTLEQVAEFIARCAELGVPFKATAGLHHPLRSMRPLTYEPNSRRAMMHGFLNVFTAAAIAWGAVRAGEAVSRFAISACLADEERRNWHFDDDALTWSGGEKPVRIKVEALRSLRSKFALSFGSCSFEEPVAEMHQMGFL
jgi:hypothetical protein